MAGSSNTHPSILPVLKLDLSLPLGVCSECLCIHAVPSPTFGSLSARHSAAAPRPQDCLTFCASLISNVQMLLLSDCCLLLPFGQAAHKKEKAAAAAAATAEATKATEVVDKQEAALAKAQSDAEIASEATMNSQIEKNAAEQQLSKTKLHETLQVEQLASASKQLSELRIEAAATEDAHRVAAATVNTVLHSAVWLSSLCCAGSTIGRQVRGIGEELSDNELRGRY